jgi:hypothetical protein
MRTITGIAGVLIIIVILVDAFNTVVLPRRVHRNLTLTGIFYRFTWSPFAGIGRLVKNGELREEYLSIYGPLSFLLLLFTWAASLVAGFGLLQHALSMRMGTKLASFGQCLYNSASALVTVVSTLPSNSGSRWIVPIEAGLGYGLLALTIGYLPVLYQSYSSRELRISLLDARAGSPATASELLRRQGSESAYLQNQLAHWEEWIAELLQEQLSYPMLAYFRSQHQNQSWIAALTAILDSSAVVLLCSEGDLRHQAQLTFAIGRHALVDLATVFRARPCPCPERLEEHDLQRLKSELTRCNTCLGSERLTAENLARFRRMYEPYAWSLSTHFLMALPGWLADEKNQDNWRSTSFDHPGGPFAVSDPMAISPYHTFRR